MTKYDVIRTNTRHAIEYRSPSDLKPPKRKVRKRSAKQLAKLAGSLKAFDFNEPILIDAEDRVVVGAHRLEAALLAKLAEIPTIRITHLSEAELRAYAIAANRHALDAGWDDEVLAFELEELAGLDLDIEITGFAAAEVEVLLDLAHMVSTGSARDKDNKIPAVAEMAVTRLGEVWWLGRHRLICGDATNAETYARLMDGDVAAMAFTDPPYNVPIDGHVGGKGSVKHREFAMAAGEMSREQFTAFLTDCLRHMAAACRDGAIAYACMDWRHVLELQTAGEAVFHELKNVCVWNKTNAGMGGFYRSKHELVFVFKVGTAEHINNFGLGETGRWRANVWDYPGISSFGKNRDAELGMHPTVKPLALVADAIKDCSNRGDIILDPFGGSGTTLIAAESCGRSARLIELDPLYCDVILRRYAAYTGKQPVLADGWNTTFEQVKQSRLKGVWA